MDSKKIVLDVGQCNPDHAAISRVLEQCGVAVLRAHTGEDAKRLISAGGVVLVLVNRTLDADGSDGMALVQELLKIGKVPVMLVSNYPEYQARAVEMGALQGFGKASLGEPATLALLRRALSQ